MLGTLCYLLSACNDDVMDPTEISGNDILKLNFSTIDTRADLDDSGVGTFSENDKIGLYIDNGAKIEYRELTLVSGEWQPLLRRSEFGSGALTISAHYPARTDISAQAEDAKISIAENQTSDGYAQSDLLFAQRTLPEGVLQADFSFTHLLHRIRIQCSGESNVSLEVHSRMEGSVNLLTGDVSADDSFGWIAPRKNTDGSFEAVILPQSAEVFRDEPGLLKIKTSKGESSYLAPEMLDGKPLDRFLAGQQLTIRLSIKQTPSDLANKSMWVYGLHVPDFPGEDKLPTYDLYDKVDPGVWFRKKRDYEEIQNLTWAEGCGWYDCHKSPDYTEDDSNICWAASASNLLLWWMNLNKAYIDAYTRDWGNSVRSADGKYVYELPSSDFLPLLTPNGQVNRNAVFNFFKVYCKNQGSWNSSGVRWFITGESTDIPTEFAGDYFPGFFTHVFDQNDVIATDSRSPTKEEFNTFIVNALQNRQALGFTVYDIAGQRTGNHALVIWGAEFDSEGIISHIYYCENNMADQDVNGAVISRVRVSYKRDELYPSNPAYYPFFTTLQPQNGSPSKSYKITSLCAVDLRQDIWAEKYPTVNPEK